MDILSRVFPVELAHMATLHAQSKKLSGFWALGTLLMWLLVRAVHNFAPTCFLFNFLVKRCVN